MLDSFPVAVCHKMRHKHLGRIPRCKLLAGKAYHGRCASKRNWFYELKVQVVTTSGGIPVEFHLHAGGKSEQAGRRGLARWICSPAACSTPMPATPTTWPKPCSTRPAADGPQKNSKCLHLPGQASLLQHFRKCIETCFSQLTAHFPKQIHAVTAEGFALKIAHFIFDYALHQVGL